MIGSIGGTLGIFIGFSFSNTITFIINYFRSLKIKTRNFGKSQVRPQFLYSKRDMAEMDDEQQKTKKRLQNQINQLQKKTSVTEGKLTVIENQLQKKTSLMEEKLAVIEKMLENQLQN